MMNIRQPGPKITDAEIASLEAKLGSPLPADYRDFLIASNGGVPRPNGIDIPGLHDSPTDVQELFGLNQRIESSCIKWNLETLVERLDPEMVPIACDSHGSVFCLSLRSEDYGAILCCDLQAVFADFESKPVYYAVAPSFKSFLMKLRPFED